jgi:hypothetical protein
MKAADQLVRRLFLATFIHLPGDHTRAAKRPGSSIHSQTGETRRWERPAGKALGIGPDIP